MTKWTPEQFWEYVGGLAGEWEGNEMRRMLSERGLSVVPQRPQERGNRFCANDYCPWPDCLIDGACPAQPDTRPVRHSGDK